MNDLASFDVFKKIGHFFIYSNLLIAFAALSACCSTYCLMGVTPLIDQVSLLIFVATLIGYILPRLLALQRMSESTREKLNVAQQIFYLRLLFGGAIVIAIYLFCVQALPIQLLLILTGSLTILYSLPLIRWKQRWRRGRDIGLFKIFLIASVWSISTAILPLVHWHITEGVNIVLSDVFRLAVERWLFIFAITLPFDIRDQQYDQEKGLQTIPLLMGAKNTLRLATFILSLLCIGSSYYVFVMEQCLLGMGMAIGYATTILLINQTHDKQPDEFYTGLLDSTITLQFVLIWWSV